MISKVPSCHFQETTYTIEANYKAIPCFVLALTFIRPLADLRIIWVGPPGVSPYAEPSDVALRATCLP